MFNVHLRTGPDKRLYKQEEKTKAPLLISERTILDGSIGRRVSRLLLPSAKKDPEGSDGNRGRVIERNTDLSQA
jgi:hypothetical protein